MAAAITNAIQASGDIATRGRSGGLVAWPRRRAGGGSPTGRRRQWGVAHRASWLASSAWKGDGPGGQDAGPHRHESCGQAGRSVDESDGGVAVLDQKVG